MQFEDQFGEAMKSLIKITCEVILKKPIAPRTWSEIKDA